MSIEKEPFDIDANSKHLKEYVAKYHSERFVADIATLLTYIDMPRISLYPFQGLDSPLRQLTDLASLNLSSDPGLATQNEEIGNDEWLEMVTTLIKIKSGYFDMLLPGQEKEDKEYAQL